MSKLIQLNKLVQGEKYMLHQFCNNLQVTVQRLSAQEAAPVESLTQLEQRLQEDPSWPEANRIELTLVEFFDDTTLLTEWQRRLAEIDDLPLNVMNFYKQQSAETEAEKVRSLLSRLITDLQWLRESQRIIRLNESQMRKKIVGLFLLGFLLFFSPTMSRILFSYEFDNLRMYYLFTAATAGILGACFSQLTSIQSRIQAASLEEVRAMGQAGYIVARALVGAGAGLIMFYLMQSGLLAGEFFPTFIQSAEEIEKYQNELARTAEEVAANIHGVSQKIESSLAVGTLAHPTQDLSVLIIWCLLAGFSEKMIPGILSNKSKAAVKSTAE